MSIRPHIVALEKANRLRPCTPRGARAKRRLYLTMDAIGDLEEPNGIIPLLGLRGMVEAGIKQWVHNGGVHTDLNGKPRFLKPLCPPPPEIWEVRFTDPRVQIRLFCRFAEPDTLIGTKFHTRQLLRHKGSQEWKAAMEGCDNTWRNLFPGIDPFSGASIHDYVTENCDDFELCK